MCALLRNVIILHIAQSMETRSYISEEDARRKAEELLDEYERLLLSLRGLV